MPVKRLIRWVHDLTSRGQRQLIRAAKVENRLEFYYALSDNGGVIVGSVEFDPKLRRRNGVPGYRLCRRFVIQHPDGTHTEYAEPVWLSASHTLREGFSWQTELQGQTAECRTFMDGLSTWFVSYAWMLYDHTGQLIGTRTPEELAAGPLPDDQSFQTAP